MTTPATPGEILDALLAAPATLARIESLLERLTAMTSASQAAITELLDAVTVEMQQYATRNEALETQVRDLANRLGASQAQIDALDLGIAADIRAAIPRIQAIVPDTPTDTGGDAGDGGAPVAAGADRPPPPAAPARRAGTPAPRTAAGQPGDQGYYNTPDSYTIPRDADDGADVGEGDRDPTYVTGQPASGAADRTVAGPDQPDPDQVAQAQSPVTEQLSTPGEGGVDPRGGVNDDYDQAEPLPPTQADQ